MIDLEDIYRKSGAYLKGHFLLSSKKHSRYYLQSAKVLEDPRVASMLADELAKSIKKNGIKVDIVCSPALGGIIAGYELARSLGVKFIFTERVGGKMTLRRGFEVQKQQSVLICEDIITTGGSALEAAEVIKEQGGKIEAFAALANRGICKREGTSKKPKKECKLPQDIPFFALGDFDFEIYDPNECPMCKDGSSAYKPGSRNN